MQTARLFRQARPLLLQLLELLVLCFELFRQLREYAVAQLGGTVQISLALRLLLAVLLLAARVQVALSLLFALSLLVTLHLLLALGLLGSWLHLFN